MKNPFQYGAELKPAQIVDRRQELRDVTRALTAQGRVFLLGPRRFGKTAILRAATAAAARSGAIVIFLDAEAYSGVGGLVKALVTEAARLLKGDAARTGERVLRFFARLRPVVSYNPLDQSWSGSITADSIGEADETPAFIEALDGVGRLAADIERPTAVVIDEFQKIVQWGGKDTEAQVRAAVQRHAGVGFVFAGSKTTLLNDMTLNPARPFYRLGIRHFLGPIPRDEFAAFVAKGFESGRYRVEAAAVDEVLDLSEEVPYNVQALSSVAWELLADREGRALTPQLVRDALALLVGRDGPFYLTLWNSLTSTQQRVLTAAVREGGVGLSSIAVTRKYYISTSTISKTLRLLEDRDLLRREEQKDAVRWRLEDPFFAAWLKE